uniref:Protein TIC 214 n=1 Tax=Sequoia sempervirens TaxID=28980 RepID=A0A172ELD6_SEQSE|nr:Ycf1 [Sequoia sempervirens]ALB37012.1 Ycf1 [Sequoia sempervirens]
MTALATFILPWVERTLPVILFGLYYGFLATLPIGPAQMYYVRSILLKDQIFDRNNKNKIVPTGKFILSGSFVGQFIVFSSIYLSPIYTALFKPHAMTLMFVPVFLFLFIKILFLNVLFPWMNNPAIEFFLGVALQLLNPALFGKSVFPRLVNIMLFRYSGNLLFLLSTAAGWLSGQILFVKMTKIFCSRVEGNTPLKLGKKRHLFAFTFQVIFFGYFMLTCYGRRPSLVLTKWNDQRSFIQGPLEEIEEDSTEEYSAKKKKAADRMEAKKRKKAFINEPVSIASLSKKFIRVLSLKDLDKDTETESVLPNIIIKPWPLLFFDSNRFNLPQRYVGVGNFILRGPVKNQVAEYFFDVCLSDGHQRISFTTPPSMSFFAKMVNLGDQSLHPNQDALDEWLVTKQNKRSYLAKELENRVRALSNGSPLVDVIEKRIRFARTGSGKPLSEVHDPLLSGPFRGSMNQFKSPWMLPPDGSTERLQKNKKSQSNNHDSTNQLNRISFIRPENKSKLVHRNEKIKIIFKWWLDRIRLFLLEEKETRRFLDEATLKDLLIRFESIYPKDSLEYVLKTLAPVSLNTRIEREIASCDKKMFNDFLLHLFLESTGPKWELLLSVLPTEQALLYERFFLVNSDELPNSRVSKRIPKEISDQDLPSEKEDLIEKKNNLDQEYEDFFVLYSKFMEFKQKPIVNDYEPRIRDFNRFIVPKWPATIVSGVYDTMAVKDCLELRPKKARQLIVIKPFDKLKELEQKKQKEREESYFLKEFFEWFKQERTEEEAGFQEQTQEQNVAKEGEDDAEEDLVTKDIHVFSYPYEGDFRRCLVKGAVRFQSRKVSVLSHWIPRPQSPHFARLEEMTQETHSKPKKLVVKRKITTSRLMGFVEQFVERKHKRQEEQRRQMQQAFDWELLHYLRACILFTHAYLRKRLYFPPLIIVKNLGRILLFQAPEWEQDWSNLNKEFYIKCNYDGYELTDVDVPKDWIKDYVKEGIQIKIVYPFRLRPWYEDSPQSTDTDKKTTSFLSLYGTENELPFGNPAKVPSFWDPIGELIWNYTSHWAKVIIERINPIIEWMKPIIEWMKPIIQRIEELLRSKKIIKINIRPDIESTEKNDQLPVIIRTRPTSNIKFSLEVVQDPSEPFSMQVDPDLDLEDSDNWTTTMHDQIKQMNEEYLVNLEIYQQLQADFKKKMDQPSPDIKSRFTKEFVRIKIWGSIFQKKSTRFIRKKLPYFMKVLYFRTKLTVIDLKISIFNLIESSLQFYMQLTIKIEPIQKLFNRNRIINPTRKKDTIKKDTKHISQAYVFHKIWQQIRSMKGSYAKDLLESRASTPLIKKNVKEFLDLQGILDCKNPEDLTAKHWKQWLKWCSGYRIAPQKKKNGIGNRLGWSEFASFLGEEEFASFLTRLQNRIKRHRYELLAYSYLDHMKEDYNGPAVQYIPEPDHQAIAKFKKMRDPSYSNKKNRDKKKNPDSAKKKKLKSSERSTMKKNSYYYFQFWLFPDIKRRVKNAKRLDDLFPPNILRKQIRKMWEFRELEIDKDFDVDAFVIQSLKEQEEEKQRKLAAIQKIKEEKKKRKEERRKTKQERLQKLESATNPEEVKNLKRAFKIEDQRKRWERMEEVKKGRERQKKEMIARQRERQAARKLRIEREIKKREKLRQKYGKSTRNSKLAKIEKRINDFLVRDFDKIYGLEKNLDKINTKKEEIRIKIKNLILERDAKINARGDKNAWDKVKSKLDSLNKKKKKRLPTQEAKSNPKERKKEKNPKIQRRKERERFERKGRRPEELGKRETKQADTPENETEKLPYPEMGKNFRVWKPKYKVQKLPLAPWFSKSKNAARFLDKKKLGTRAAVAELTRSYFENGEFDLELLETILHLKSYFKKNKNGFFRIFADKHRRSMPLLPGYFNDRFLIYKIASLFLKMKRKRKDVNLFDRSERIKRDTIENVNEKISSSFIFEDIFLPRRRREFRILNLLNLENHLDESTELNSKEIPNDEGLMEKDEHLIIDTRQKIRRFLWPRYRLEDLICMNRYWWNTNNGSRSAMLRVRMYPKIDHWEHIQNSLNLIKDSFVSIREILQDLGNRTKSFLGRRHSPVFGRNETMNEVKESKTNSFCSTSLSFPSDRSPCNKLREKLQTEIIPAVKKLKDEIISFLKELKDEIISPVKILQTEIISAVKKLKDEIISAVKKLKDEIISFLKELKDEIISPVKILQTEIISAVKKLKDEIISSLEELRKILISLINRFLSNLINVLKIWRRVINRGKPRKYIFPKLVSKLSYLFSPISFLFSPISFLFSPIRFLFSPIRFLFSSIGYLFSSIGYLFSSIGYLFSSIGALFRYILGKK